MFQFKREKILPLFMQKQMTVEELSKQAGVCSKTTFRAVNGLPVKTLAVGKIAHALNIDALEYLEDPRGS